jgi:lysophospholipase L1-like esterase
MMGKLITAIILMILFLACKKPDNSFQPVPFVPTIPNPDTTGPGDTLIERTYLALGDSYTIGQSVDVNQRFPVQAVAMLNNLNVPFKQPEIIAQTGWTTGALLYRIDNNPPARTEYDIVTLLIGVNNQYQGRTQDEYRQQFITLLERAIQYAGNKKHHVFVLSIPDYSVTPFAAGRNRELIAAQIDSFNVINKTISDQYQVNYIDITGDSRQATVYPSLIANDGLHPSGEQYRLWAAKLAPAVRVLFQ